MPLELNPTNLKGLVDLPVGMYPQQQEFLANASQADSNELQQQGLRNLFDAQANPLRVRGLELNNRTAEAGLPGIMANSSISQRKNRVESLLEDSHIQDMMGKYKADELKRHISEVEGLGQIALQGAEQVWSNPLAGRALVKAQLEKSGMWNPKWDALPPDQLAMQLSNFGQGIQGTIAKFSQASQLQQDKLDAQERMKKLEVEGRAEAARVRAESAKALVDAKTERTPRSYQEASTKWRQLEMAETDPEMKAKFKMAADLYAEEALKLATMAAQVGASTKPVLKDGKIDYAPNPMDKGGPKLGTKENPIKLD